MNNIKSDIKISNVLEKDFYLDDSIYNKVINIVFHNSWQLITDINSVKSNNIFPFIFLKDSINEPMILTINNDIKCISNVCTHRAHIIIKKKCSKQLLQCPYHGRIFTLNGNLNQAPGFESALNFPSKNDDLVQYKSIKWHNFLFASIVPNIDINLVLNDIDNRLPNYNFLNLEYDSNNSRTYILDAHWALYCENYLEGFHVPFVHKGLSKDISYSSYQTILLDYGVLQIANSSNLNESIDNTNNIYAYYYWIFPNLMINIYNWGVSINIIEPINKSKTRIRFLSYPFKNEVQPLNLDSSLDNIELEDQNVVLEVQKGIKSYAYKSGRYSPKYEKGIHHFHKLLCDYIN